MINTGQGSVLVNPSRKSGRARAKFLLVPAALFLVLTGTLFFVYEPAVREVARDGDLCPIEPTLGGNIVSLLFDFRKPLDGVQANSPGKLLRDLTLKFGHNTEFQVFFLTGSATAPVALLKRLCKPYNTDDLQVAQAKDRTGAVRDCDNLPAQLADGVRQSATRFCDARQALELRIDALATNAGTTDQEVTSAFLVEALEDIGMKDSDRAGKHHLYVFSDMMQHSNWYSHLDLGWMNWDSGEFSDLLDARNRLFRRSQNDSDIEVDIYYLPRSGTTDQPRVKELHWQFWQDYFGDALVAFHELQPASPYSSKPLMNLFTDAELAAQERTATEQLRIELENEQQALARQQQELEAERQKQAELTRQLELERVHQAAIERRQDNVEAQSETERQLQGEVDQGLEAEFPGRVADVERLDTEYQPRIEAEKHPERGPRIIAEAEQAASAQPDQTALRQQQTAQIAPKSTLANNGQPTNPTVPLCPISILSNIEEMAPAYPNRGGEDYGDAVITVQYEIDELGETVDNKIAVVAERSTADRTRHFRRFAREAVRQVRKWSFSFDESIEQTCAKRRTTETSFQFRYD